MIVSATTWYAIKISPPVYLQFRYFSELFSFILFRAT